MLSHLLICQAAVAEVAAAVGPHLLSSKASNSLTILGSDKLLWICISVLTCGGHRSLELSRRMFEISGRTCSSPLLPSLCLK